LCDRYIATASRTTLRIRRRAVEDGHGRRACERRDDLVEDAGRADARIGHDQRPADADALAFAGQQPDGAALELDLRNVVDEGHDR
jgi:hypothetical protein